MKTLLRRYITRNILLLHIRNDFKDFDQNGRLGPRLSSFCEAGRRERAKVGKSIQIVHSIKYENVQRHKEHLTLEQKLTRHDINVAYDQEGTRIV